MKKEINTDKAPQAIGPYSQAILHGNTVFISGQLPINPINSSIPNTIEEQTKQSLSNIIEILQSCGATTNNIVKCGIFIKNMDDFSKINEVYTQYFKAPYPARFVVEVSRLPKDALIEIDAIAIV